MFYILEKIEVSISSDSKDTTNRTIKFFPKNAVKKHDLQEYHTPASQ